MTELVEPCVCDLTLVMRTRLVCGMYNRRSVPPRWRHLARAYCVTVLVATSILVYLTHSFWRLNFLLYMTPSLVLYYLSIFISLCTEDEYIYKFFSQNKMTDVTLDATKIFSRLQKRVKQLYYISMAVHVVSAGLIIVTFNRADLISFGLVCLVAIIDVFLAFSSSRNLLIMALFNARLLVLKRRLQRYGFRTIGRAQPQPYCQIYDEILKGLDATDQPFKLLLFFDLMCNCYKLIAVFGFYLIDAPWKNLNIIDASKNVIISAISLAERLVFSFGYVAFLESAAVHCEDMAVFTVTQLIKAPTVEETRRMREFLSALERRGARYRVLRALPLDARFVLRALGFCSAQIIVAATAILANSGGNQ